MPEPTDQDVIDGSPCPFCTAHQGYPCITKTGLATEVHLDRRKAYRFRQERAREAEASIGREVAQAEPHARDRATPAQRARVAADIAAARERFAATASPDRRPRQDRLDDVVGGAIYSFGLALALLHECRGYLPEATGIQEELDEELPAMHDWLTRLREAYES